jgi:hypothetical protein
MHVHIVCRDGNHVIPRLANELVNASCGRWTMGDNPNPKADINYFFPYLEMELCGAFNATKTTSYFSHYEYDNKHKAAIWDKYVQNVGLRIVTAQLYGNMIECYGETALVRPAVDPQFMPGTKPNRNVVGVSGVVSKSSKRKGLKLVHRLQAKRKDIEIRASGSGWDGIATQYFRWEEMHNFYQSLDVFLCTSTIEGVPMTTLEAMACGVPVVIPSGVGLHNEIGHIPGVFYYTAGNYAEMETSIDSALTFNGSTYDMMKRTSEYNTYNWYMDHQRAFERLLYDKKNNGNNSPNLSKENCGIYIVAYGDNARDCARNLITSIRQFMDIEVALVSSEPIGMEDHFIVRDDTDIGARGAKLSIEKLAPPKWEYILYLDADTELTGPIWFLFEVLADGWELVICKNPERYHVIFNMVRPDYLAECKETFEMLGSDELIQLNGGVWAYRRTPQTRLLMQTWYNEWNRYGARDQAALLRALKQYPIKTYVLGNEWNTVDRYEKSYAHPTAGIMHYPMTARRWEGRINGRLDSNEAWRKVK